MIKINDVRQIWLGIQGENNAREIRIDVSEWLTGNPNGSFSIWMKAPGSNVPMATGATFDAEEGVLTWSPASTETYTSGEGTAEIRMTEGEVIKKTKEIRIGISPAVTSQGATLSSDWQAFINEADRIKGLAVAAANRAEDEATHPPYINLNSYRWMIWDRTNQEYVDSGISAQGVPGPEGPRGADGRQGPAGPAGPQGIQGIQGIQGERGPAGQAGEKGDNGDPFKIRKTYTSIAAMEADYGTSQVALDEFVIIQTEAGGVDNGKVYKKGNSAWEFIVQMAGVEGPQGPAGPAGPSGPQGIQGIQGERGPAGQDGEQGPRGIQGPEGPGVPAGGTAGQYLRKNSGTDYDGDWESPANNLTTTEAGLVLDARQGKVLNDSIGNVADGLAILANGNTHEAIAKDQFVYVRNHSSLAEGLYKASAAISANGTLSTSNLTADSDGGLNAIKADVDTLNSNLMNDKIIKRNASEVHNFIFPNQSANIIAVNGNGGSRQYVAYVYNSTNSLTIFELGKGNGVTVSTNASTLSLTLNETIACTVRIINVSGSNNVT